MHADTIFAGRTGFILFAAVLCGLLSGCRKQADLNWIREGHYRWAELPGNFFGHAGFDEVNPKHSGIHFANRVTREELADNRYYLNGSGVAAGDIDGDGLADLYFAGLGVPNRLYRNRGNFRFEEITEQAGVAHEGAYSTAAVFADTDGDADLDLLVTSNSGRHTLYLNDGSGHFRRDGESGLGAAHGSTGMALADIDGDGDLDLYIVNYKEKSVRDLYAPEELEWNHIVNEPYDRKTTHYTLVAPFDRHYAILTRPGELPRRRELGRPDELYLNEDGRFRKVADPRERFLDAGGSPLGLPPDWGLAAKFHDLNGDGLPDLYVCNDFWTIDRVWLNRGDGTFREAGRDVIRNFSHSSMAVDFSDINRDGRPDIFVTEMLAADHRHRLRQVGSDPFPRTPDSLDARLQYNRNSLYLQQPGGAYAEIAYLAGLAGTGWSWAARFMDIDLDGYEDLVVTTGYSYDILNIDAQFGMLREGMTAEEHFSLFTGRTPGLELENKLFRNEGRLRFDDRSTEWGFGEPDVAQGLATADLDNDGDLDLVMNRLGREAALYENRGNAPRIAIRLKGAAPNTQAVGARITLSGGPVTQQKEITAGGDYASGSDPLQVFAAGGADREHTVTVHWPDGAVTRIDGVRANRIYEIDRAASPVAAPSAASVDSPDSRVPMFRDRSARLNHRHREDTYDDFTLQPLLPHKLSQQGPPVAWFDSDGDGDDDLFIGSARGYRPSLFENRDGTFRKRTAGPLTTARPGDLVAAVAWTTGEGAHLLTGSSNYEQGSPGAPSAYRFLVRPAGNEPGSLEEEPVEGSYPTTGPLSMADYDGDLDLFVGGRFLPGQYPRNSSSRLFRNERGSFVADEVNTRKLDGIGLVNGSVFSDYDRDGDPDLLLSLEWGPVLLLENRDGIFNDRSAELELGDHKGWWNGIATGDFNNDGLPDIVVTNLGLNSPYRPGAGNDGQSKHALRSYYDDLDGDGSVEILESYYDESLRGYVPRRRLFRFGSIPAIRNRYPAHGAFAAATIEQVLGARAGSVPYKEITTVEHTLFLNRGDRFEARPLPVRAQFSAALATVVADFDNDGNEDLFLGQNLFTLFIQTPRLDSGRGLLLLGDGSGTLEPVPAVDSGIRIFGEQRGAAHADFNGDGRTDLVVTQNEGGTVLLENRTAQAGLRIRLAGPPANRYGIGSSIRLRYPDGGAGPLREIQAGAGYRSQNSAVQVMGFRTDPAPAQIEVTWFDGKHQAVEIARDRTEYVISYPGAGSGPG